VNDFDKEFDKQFKRVQRASWVLFAINAVIGIGVIGGIAYAAVHFIKKFW
jgi:hypothetical protein